MSSDNKKTKKELIEELVELRNRVEEAESDHIQNIDRSKTKITTPGGLADSLDDIQDGLIQLNKLGTIIDVNQAAADIFGGSKDELINKHFTQIGIFSPGEIPSLLKQFKNILCGRNRKSTLEITNKLGQVLFVESSVSVRQGSDGSITIVAMVRDITEQKRAQQEMKNSEKRFRELFHKAPD